MAYSLDCTSKRRPKHPISPGKVGDWSPRRRATAINWIDSPEFHRSLLTGSRWRRFRTAVYGTSADMAAPVNLDVHSQPSRRLPSSASPQGSGELIGRSFQPVDRLEGVEQIEVLLQEADHKEPLAHGFPSHFRNAASFSNCTIRCAASATEETRNPFSPSRIWYRMPPALPPMTAAPFHI